MKKNVRRGFTLPEVLVTVTVVAVLAAVVVPAVTQFAGKADAPSTKQDVTGLTTAITSFTSDIRHLPGDLRQLSNLISTTATSAAGLDEDAAHLTEYGAADIGKWKGPYSGQTLNPSGAFTTAGLNVQVGPTLTLSATSGGWLQAQITKIAGVSVDCRGLLAFDAVMDGVPTATGNEGTTGLVRFDATCTKATDTGPFGTAYLRLVPGS
jgi:prepilin-type N-terminal cleavage/methylation domain-containing protein